VESITTYHNDWTGAQAFTAYDVTNNRIVIAWRGSADIQNWINNLDFFFTDYPNAMCSRAVNSSCKVHQGFLNVYSSISEAVLNGTSLLVAKYLFRRPQLLVTGHSLGGAASILCSVDASLRFGSQLSDIVVYTYGEPRVGNPAWTQWVTESILQGSRQFRLTHKADPVPRLPPLEFGFLHVPHELWYNNDAAGDNYRNCTDTAFEEDYSCDDSQIAFAVQDHLLYLGVHAGCNMNG
jgi:predicted lipase